MNIKEDLKTVVREALDKQASGIFLKGALTKIDESGNDKESLAAAADRIGKMVSLFIDEALADSVLQDLKARIETNREC